MVMWQRKVQFNQVANRCVWPCAKNSAVRKPAKAIITVNATIKRRRLERRSVRLVGIKQTALAPEVGISRQALVLIESSGLLAGPGGRRRDRA
jgi:hypothetical protein